ncbi:hypothetical protein DERP_006353 [Dermatophagoides pteronyssinus]|uniref:Uncharacterized protein n=1 Tax=Dermatophagoides pteronyssinus TaxID=6956 RepID=A0ABQ8IY75_DERPT|nr:hypothetical protein DERP_006353 [Dermatophagoides pteronyssinus]
MNEWTNISQWPILSLTHSIAKKKRKLQQPQRRLIFFASGTLQKYLHCKKFYSSKYRPRCVESDHIL